MDSRPASRSQERQLEVIPGRQRGGFPAHACPHLPVHRLSARSATHTCCPLPDTSFKEVSVPEKSKPLRQVLEATVALLSQLQESLGKESFDKEKGKERPGRGGYDYRRAEQTISSPDTGKLVPKVTCF